MTGGPRSPREDLALQVLALGARLQELAASVSHLGGIGEQVTTLADELDALRDQVADLVADDGDGGGIRMWDWIAMNRTEATVAWSTLLNWVDEVLVGVFALVGEIGGRKLKIPPCWYRHPDAVEELGWLCQEWLRIYQSDKGTPGAAGEWHDRWLPGVIRRLAQDSQMAACLQEGRHVDPRPGQAIDDQAAARAAVQEDINRRPEAPPPPIPGK
jgi:hypothetical protein